MWVNHVVNHFQLHFLSATRGNEVENRQNYVNE